MLPLIEEQIENNKIKMQEDRVSKEIAQNKVYANQLALESEKEQNEI